MKNNLYKVSRNKKMQELIDDCLKISAKTLEVAYKMEELLREELTNEVLTNIDKLNKKYKKLVKKFNLNLELINKLKAIEE